MISTFDGMARFGTGNARVMASGISQAMITTQAGLIIALPGLFMGNFLRRRSDNMARKISTYATGLVGAGRASHPPLTAEFPHGH
jgi:biopolymer transport protein ExbB